MRAIDNIKLIALFLFEISTKNNTTNSCVSHPSCLVFPYTDTTPAPAPPCV